MDELRWSLLIIGLIVLIAIYLAGQRRRARSRHDLLDEARRLDEQLEVTFNARQLKNELTSEEISEQLDGLDALLKQQAVERGSVMQTNMDEAGEYQATQVNQTQENEDERLLILHIAAKRPAAFSGDALLNLFDELRLEYGEMEIFHRFIDEDVERRIVFSVANMVNPGTFDLQHLHDFICPGLSLFARLPGPMNSVATLDEMLLCATELATRLDGEILDNSRSKISKQTIEHMREEIRDFALRHTQHAAIS